MSRISRACCVGMAVLIVICSGASVSLFAQEGDWDGDGVLGEPDLELLSSALRGGDQSPQYDLDRDGVVSWRDRDYWIHDLKRTFKGDANWDGIFQTDDLVAVFQVNEYEDSLPLNSTWSEGDWDGDGEFTTSDFVVAVQENECGLFSGGYCQGPRTAVPGVPEPSGIVMFSAALVVRWRTQRGFQRARTK